MAKAEKQQLGTYLCWSCKKETPVKKSIDSGRLSAVCAWCDFPHYAYPGTEHYKNLIAATTPSAAPAPAPEPKGEPAPEPKAEPKAKTTRPRPAFLGGSGG